MSGQPMCPRCGTPMRKGTAFLNLGSGCETLDLPATCPDRDCQRAAQAERDEKAMEKAIRLGIIDP